MPLSKKLSNSTIGKITLNKRIISKAINKK